MSDFGKGSAMKRCGLAVLVVGAAVLALGSLLAWSAEKGATEATRAEFLKSFRAGGMSTTRGDAMLLRILVETKGAKRGVEVGTFHGFGAINMGIAFERTGGRLDTVDIDPGAVKISRENLRKCSLEKTVTCIEGDALNVLPALEGEVDFAFLDARKEDYLKYLQALLPKMKPGAVLAADNVIQSAGAMKDFLDFIQASPEWDAVIVRASMDKGDGMLVGYYRGK